jgi:hypothetical protein
VCKDDLIHFNTSQYKTLGERNRCLLPKNDP